MCYNQDYTSKAFGFITLKFEKHVEMLFKLENLFLPFTFRRFEKKFSHHSDKENKKQQEFLVFNAGHVDLQTNQDFLINFSENL